MLLEPEQEELLGVLVEGSRTVADRSERIFSLTVLNASKFISGPNLGQEGRRVEGDDIPLLEQAGLVRVVSRGKNLVRFRVTPEGERHYEALKTRADEPVREVEDDLRSYLESDALRSRYAAAYRKFSEAERLLWRSDSQEQLTAVGHHAREALQEFATALVERHRPPSVNPSPTATRDRLSAVLNMHRPQLGERRSDFLDALFAYWREVDSLAQRQEHGGQKEGEPLTWEDARRLVLHTAVVMVEVARTLDPLAPPT